MKHRTSKPKPLYPFVLASAFAHSTLLVVLTTSRDSTPRVALVAQAQSVRLVLPPQPAPVEPEPLPEPEPEPEPQEPEPLPEPEPEPIPEPEPEPVAPLQPEVPLLPEPAAETPEPEPIPTPEPEPLPEPIEPEPQPEPQPQPQPEAAPPVPAPVPPAEEPPQDGDADKDEAGIEVEAVPDPSFAPRPKYPRKARVRRWEGTALVEVDVNEKGRPTRVTLYKTSGHKILDDAALEAVRTWKFLPGERGGEVAATTVRVPVTFRLVDR